MITIEINNSKEIISTLEKISEKISDRTDLMADLAQTMRNAVQENFSQQGRPAWLGLKAPNRRNHILRGDTGDLESGIFATSDNHRVTVASNTLYAPIHHFGGTIRPKKSKYLKFKMGDRWVQKKEVKIPARPFMALTPQDEADLLDDVQSYFQTLVD